MYTGDVGDFRKEGGIVWRSRDTVGVRDGDQTPARSARCPPGCEAQARRFSGQLLDLREIEKPEPLRASGGVWFALSDDQELHIGVEDPFEPARKAHPAFEIAVDEIDRIAERLTGADTKVEWDDAIAGYRRFYTADPWGNRIELLAPTAPA